MVGDIALGSTVGLDVASDGVGVWEHLFVRVSNLCCLHSDSAKKRYALSQSLRFHDSIRASA